MKQYPLIIDACVVLPNHLHCIWTLPEGDSDFSTRWRLIKSYFSRKCDERCKRYVSAVRRKKKEQAVWQRRFWEHQIRDEDDFVRHVEYIYFNPVKHGLVKAPKDWPYSSFHRDVRDGKCDLEWGAGIEIKFDPSIGIE